MAEGLLNLDTEETQEVAAQQTADGQQAAESQRIIEYKGERLEIPEPFWDAESGAPNVGALAKAAADLRRKVSEKEAEKPQAPESYELRVPEELAERIKPIADDPLAKSAMDWAKKHGIPQEAFDELAAAFYGDIAGKMPDQAKEMDALKQALGPKAESDIKELDAWAAGLLGEDFKKSPELLEAALRLSSTAAGVMLLKTIKDKIGERPVPTPRDGQAVAVLDEEGIRQIMMTDAYRDGDSATHRKVQEAWERLYRE